MTSRAERSAPHSGLGSAPHSLRRGQDSNLRALAGLRFSRPAPSTTRPPLRSDSTPLSCGAAERDLGHTAGRRVTPCTPAGARTWDDLGGPEGAMGREYKLRIGDGTVVAV